MPTVAENRERWQHHAWALQGDEWSPGRSPEGTLVLWERTILPRVHRFLPADTILEIGPGLGRWTQFLRKLCRRLVIVDVSERCIDACRARFADDPYIEYIVNDGFSLERVEDGSVDFLFSFDSLVHAEADAVGMYLAQAARKLRNGGAGFIHHSNLHTYVHPRSKRVRWFVTNRHWRAESMSADVFRENCETAGLSLRSQELINWVGRGRRADRHHLNGRSMPLIDCFSVFALDAGPALPARRIANPMFVEEWRQAVWMASVYYAPAGDIVRPAALDASPFACVRKLRTAAAIGRRDGWLRVLSLARARIAGVAEHGASAARSHLTGIANRWFLRRRVARERLRRPPADRPGSVGRGERRVSTA